MTLEITVSLIALAIFSIAAGLGLCAGWALRPKNKPCPGDSPWRSGRTQREAETPQPWRHDSTCQLSNVNSYLAHVEGTEVVECVCGATLSDSSTEPPRPPACVDCARMMIGPESPELPKCGGTFDPVTGEAGYLSCGDERHRGCGPTGRYFKALAEYDLRSVAGSPLAGLPANTPIGIVRSADDMQNIHPPDNPLTSWDHALNCPLSDIRNHVSDADGTRPAKSYTDMIYNPMDCTCDAAPSGDN